MCSFKLYVNFGPLMTNETSKYSLYKRPWQLQMPWRNLKPSGSVPSFVPEKAPLHLGVGAAAPSSEEECFLLSMTFRMRWGFAFASGKQTFKCSYKMTTVHCMGQSQPLMHWKWVSRELLCVLVCCWFLSKLATYNVNLSGMLMVCKLKSLCTGKISFQCLFPRQMSFSPIPVWTKSPLQKGVWHQFHDLFFFFHWLSIS